MIGLCVVDVDGDPERVTCFHNEVGWLVADWGWDLYDFYSHNTNMCSIDDMFT